MEGVESEYPLRSSESVPEAARVSVFVADPSAALDPTRSVPALMVLPPVYVFVPERMSVPRPRFSKPLFVPVRLDASETVSPESISRRYAALPVLVKRLEKSVV
jgi:hypothetical protein